MSLLLCLPVYSPYSNPSSVTPCHNQQVERRFCAGRRRGRSPLPERVVYKVSSHAKSQGRGGSGDRAPRRSRPAASSCCLAAGLCGRWGSRGGCHTCSAHPSERCQRREQTKDQQHSWSRWTLHATGVGFALAQHPSSVGSLFPAAPRVRLVKLPGVYCLPSFLRCYCRIPLGFLVLSPLLLAGSAAAVRPHGWLCPGNTRRCLMPCLDGLTRLNLAGQKSPPRARGEQSSGEGVNKGFNIKRPHSKAQVRASCTPPPASTLLPWQCCITQVLLSPPSSCPTCVM